MDANVLLLAGEASLASGDMKQATAYYQQVAAKGQKSEAAAAHTRLGQIAMATGRQDDGVRELESAAAVDPAFRETDLAMISSYLRSGELDKALGAARAEHGVGIGETLDDLTHLYRVLEDGPPPIEAVRALCEGWAAPGGPGFVATTCMDPESGLPTAEYLAVRLRATP